MHQVDIRAGGGDDGVLRRIAVVVVQKSSEMLVGEATRSVKGEAKRTIAKIDRMMAGVQAVIENQRWNVTDHIDDPDYMFHIADGIAATTKTSTAAALLSNLRCGGMMKNGRIKTT